MSDQLQAVQHPKETISKAVWLMAGRCPTMAWFSVREAPEAPDEADQFRMKQGQEIGALARELFPTGVLVPRMDTPSSAERTASLISGDTIEIFQATFQA